MTRVKVFLFALAALTVMALAAVPSRSLSAQPAHCYECNDGHGPDEGCQVCTTGTTGHVSCIPYCNGTCLIGSPTGCGGQAFNTLHVSPDGTPAGFVLLTKSELTAGTDKNCAGFVIAQAVTEVEGTNLRNGTTSLQI